MREFDGTGRGLEPPVLHQRADKTPLAIAGTVPTPCDVCGHEWPNNELFLLVLTQKRICLSCVESDPEIAALYRLWAEDPRPW